MPLTPDRGLQLRIAGALALVVAINGVVLSVLAWSGHRVLSASGRSVPTEIGLSLSVGVILLSAVGLVAVQARYGSRTVVSGLDLDAVDGTGPRGVEGRLRRLAAQADVPVTSVAIADRPEPGCLTVGTQRSPTIVVTSGLLDRLDDDELDAALAHEIAHVANHDLPVVTAVAATVAIGDRLLERERRLRRILETTVLIAIVTGIGVIIFAFPILLLLIVYLVVSAVARVLLAVNAIALGLFAKNREYAADRGASQLTGNPAALASALETLEDDRPTRDARRDARIDATATLGIVTQPLSLESNDEPDGQHWAERYFPKLSFEGPAEPNVLERGLIRFGRWGYARTVAPLEARIRRVLGWRPPTHPPTDARIAQLRTVQRRRHQ